MPLHIDAEMIKSAAARHGIPWEIVTAVVQTESAFQPWSIRYEPGYSYLHPPDGDFTPTERNAQKTSYGVMQVMGAVAREYGHRGWLTELCDPPVGLEYGCRHLAAYFKRYRNWSEAIAAYNAGSPRRTESGELVNQEYVNKVLMAADTLGWGGR